MTADFRDDEELELLVTLAVWDLDGEHISYVDEKEKLAGYG